MNKQKASIRKVNNILGSIIPELSAGPKWTSLQMQAAAQELKSLLKQAGVSLSVLGADKKPTSQRQLLAALRWAARIAYKGNASPKRKQATAKEFAPALSTLKSMGLKGTFPNAASLWAVMQLQLQLPVYERVWLNAYVAELQDIVQGLPISEAVRQAHDDALRTCQMQGVFKGSDGAVPTMYLAYLEGYFRFVRQEYRRMNAKGAVHARLGAVRKDLLTAEVERVYPSLVKVAERNA